MNPIPPTSTALILALIALTQGCAQPRIGGKANENDALRASVQELEGRLHAAQLENAELRAKLAMAPQTGSAPSDPVVREATPIVAGISIERLSHARDDDGDGRADRLVVYLKPVDGRGRAIQLVGTVEIHAAVIGSQTDSVTLGRASFTPLEVRDAYRSAFMGTHYTFEFAIDPAAAHPNGRSTVKAYFHDALTGADHEALSEISLIIHE